MTLPITARLLALALVFTFTGHTAWAQFMEVKEYAAEIDNVNFGNAPTSGGLIYVQRCDSCPKMGVTFRAQTQFFDGDRAISASLAERFSERGATLMFDPDTRYVTRVIYWPSK